MQHYASAAVPQIRAAGAAPAQYGIATPSGPVEHKKIIPPARLPVAGRFEAPAPHAVAAVVQAVPTAVAAAPTPAPATVPPAKITPQLQHLPKFQPPCFEGANGSLPLPDSPGSTPREGNSTSGPAGSGAGPCVTVNATGSTGGGSSVVAAAVAAGVSSDSVPGVPTPTAAVLSAPVPMGPGPLGPILAPPATCALTEQRPAQMVAQALVAEDERPSLASQAQRLANASETAAPSAAPAAMGGPSPPAPAAVAAMERIPATPYAVGSIVEYKSRSSGQWILAKVDGYDEVNHTYKLDVQPHAHPDRVRPRQHGPGVSVSQHSEHAPDASAEQAASVGHGGVELTRPLGYQSHHSASTVSRDGRHHTLRPCGGDAVSPRVDRRSAPESRSAEADGSTGRHQADALQEAWKKIEFLTKQVARLEAEKEQLHDKVLQEAALKDRYLSELSLCHEQMSRMRSTPR